MDVVHGLFTQHSVGNMRRVGGLFAAAGSDAGVVSDSCRQDDQHETRITTNAFTMLAGFVAADVVVWPYALCRRARALK